MTMYPEADYSLYKFAFTRHPILFCIIHGLVVVFTVVLPFTDQFHWAVLPIMALVEVGYWIGTNAHRNRLRKMNEKGPNNKHRSDVCETCNPVCWKATRGPLLELRVYYAAITDVSWEIADHELARMHPSALQSWKEYHAKYLLRKEFDKFLRK